MKIIRYILVFSFTLSASFSFADGSLTYKAGQHIPLIMILDLTRSESPIGDANANVWTFNFALQAQNSAILISRNVLYNFLYRKQHPEDPRNYIYQSTDISNSTWDLYTLSNPKYFVDGNELYLFIPQSKKTLFSSIFNFSNMFKISEFPYPHFNYLDALTKRTTYFGPLVIKPLEFLSSDLTKIFKVIPSTKERALLIHRPETWQAPIIDIYLNGHGQRSPLSLIANLNPEQLQAFLVFLNTKLRIGTLIIRSCYAGGENIRKFRFIKDIKNSEIFYPLNFIIVAESTGDISTYAHPVQYAKLFFLNIFDILQKLGNDPKHDLSSLLGKIIESPTAPEFPHGGANIPQIILPGGIEIQSLTPDKHVLVLGKVKVKAAELENKSIYIDPKKDWGYYDYPLNVLIYPNIINAEIIDRASRLAQYPFGRTKKGGLKYLPSFSDLITENKITFEQTKALVGFPININYLNQNHYLYPNILSMKHGYAYHWFKKITFLGNVLDGSGGILMGLRDSFFYILKRPTPKTFYIDQLEGPNDISLILKTLRLIKGDYEKSLLERELPEGSKNITLKNVSISTQGEDLYASIKFQYNNSAWQFVYNSANWKAPNPFQKQWNFTRIDAKSYEKAYLRLKSNNFHISPEPQKPLVDILKEKQAKYQEIKKQSMINSLSELSSALNQLANTER